MEDRQAKTRIVRIREEFKVELPGTAALGQAGNPAPEAAEALVRWAG